MINDRVSTATRTGRIYYVRGWERMRGRKCFAWFSRENDGRQVSLIDDRTRKWDSLIELAEEINEGEGIKNGRDISSFARFDFTLTFGYLRGN